MSRRQILDAEAEHLVASEYSTGATYAELAARYGVSAKTIYSILSAHGINRRKRGGAHHSRIRHAYRVHCDREQRPCVLHDVPGSCDVCATQRQQMAGIVSMFSAMMEAH